MPSLKKPNLLVLCMLEMNPEENLLVRAFLKLIFLISLVFMLKQAAELYPYLYPVFLPSGDPKAADVFCASSTLSLQQHAVKLEGRVSGSRSPSKLPCQSRDLNLVLPEHSLTLLLLHLVVYMLCSLLGNPV